ncbi:hypothetical protein AHAS_Ahas07G0059500 [Arachis hypogaea]
MNRNSLPSMLSVSLMITMRLTYNPTKPTLHSLMKWMVLQTCMHYHLHLLSVLTTMGS